MDSKDFQLLVGLFENARQSHRALACRVSLSAPVVRDRLKRLEAQGILHGYMLSVDPGVFERDDLLVFFHQGKWTREDAARVLIAPDVAWVSWKLDGGLTVGAWPKDRNQTVQRLAMTLGSKPSGDTFTERPKHRRLSVIDLQVIDALVDQPTRSLKQLVRSTGLSPKTVRKHLEILVRRQTIFVEPRLGALAGSGELVYQLAVFGRVAMDELRRVIGNAFLVNEMQEPPAKSLLCLGSDLGEVTSKTKAVGELPGVQSVRITLNREILASTEFLHTLISEQIQTVHKTRSGWPT